MATHAKQDDAATGQRRGTVRPKILTPQACSTEHADQIMRTAAASQAATIVAIAAKTCGIGRAQLGRRIRQSASRINRKLSPDDYASFTLTDLLVTRLTVPRLFVEVLHALGELETDGGEPWIPAASHFLRLVRLVGRLSAAVDHFGLATGRDIRERRRKVEALLSEIQTVVVQMRRDLLKGE